MEARALRSLFKSVVLFSHSRFRLFYSSPAAASPRIGTFFSDDDPNEGSSVYRHALKFQRPSTIEWRGQLCNSVSFIGSVDRPLQRMNAPGGLFGVYTLLNVKASQDSSRFFKILLAMQNEMAEICMKHLKPNDFIYVSGHLGSYTKADINGNCRTYYKVNVKKVHYVAQNGKGATCQKAEQSETGGSGETRLEEYNKRQYLWQLFFSSPHEWYDNRKSKKSPKSPDFKHKDTGEALWLNPGDPSWIRRQLQLHDSRLAKQVKEEHGKAGPQISPLVYVD